MTAPPSRSVAEAPTKVEMARELLGRWMSAATALGATGDHAKWIGERSLAALGEDGRVYSTAARLEQVLSVVDRLDHRAERPDAVRVAAWVHVVTGEQAGTSSQASSHALLNELHLSPSAAALLGRLLEVACAGTAEYEDPDGRVVCDALLADLGASPTHYVEAVERQRQQRGYDVDTWSAVRRGTLKALSCRDSLFTTPEMRATREPRAQLNLALEAARLRSAGGA